MTNFIRMAVVTLFMMPAAGAAQISDGERAYINGDYEAALQELRPQAEGGLTSAQYALAQIYKTGSAGVPKDYFEAIKWLRMAAEQGGMWQAKKELVELRSHLADIYSNRDNAPDSNYEEVQWYRQAAEQGLAEAQYQLGYMYANGEGVPQNYPTAHIWSNVAAANGIYEAAEIREMVEDRMTKEQIAEAQTRALVCMETGYQDCD